jgi:predicted RNase H-like nuclease (RuvC/YqgF family)
MSYSPDQVAKVNDTSALKRRIAALEEENEQLRGQVQWCRNRIETYKQEFVRRNHGLHG